MVRSCICCVWMQFDLYVLRVTYMDIAVWTSDREREVDALKADCRSERRFDRFVFTVGFSLYMNKHCCSSKPTVEDVGNGMFIILLGCNLGKDWSV